MAPLTSDALNAIRTTLSRNISQIGVERLAASERDSFARPSATRFIRPVFPNKKTKVTLTAGNVIFNRIDFSRLCEREREGGGRVLSNIIYVVNQVQEINKM